MAVSHRGQPSLVHSLATLLRNDGDGVLAGSSTLTLHASSLVQLTGLFEQYLLTRSQAHGFLALPSHPADTGALLRLQFLFDVLQKTLSLKIVEPPGSRTRSVVKIFPFKSLKSLELKRIPPHCLEGLRGMYSQLEVFTCSKSLSSLEELLSLCGGDLSSALPWLELHTLNFSYNSITCLDQSLSLLNVLKFLDLSHNKIQECAEFLKPLSELEHLNLGYNNLQRVPLLGTSARAKLCTLILRNNELETINGVEQLSSLQHLDLSYNLLLEHSQLAPLSLLHVLHTLNLEGNPLFFQKNHRTCTVRHLSPKAAYLRLKLDSCQLTSSELSVMPKPGQLRGLSQAPPQVAKESERGNEEVSSGAGELSDSLSVGDPSAVTRVRRKKARAKVRVRRASISEPSDTEHEPRRQTPPQDAALPHQKDIERMDSFREQLGMDWLRYQHHLEVAPTSTLPPPGCGETPPPRNRQPLANGLDDGPCAPPPGTARPQTPPEVPPPPPVSSEPREEASGGDTDPEGESTLQWSCCQSPGQTETSTLEMGDVPGEQLESRRPAGTRSRSTGEEEEKEEEEEEEDLGVDQCLPLLVGVLSEEEEEEEEEEDGSGGRQKKEVFLRVKQGVVMEVDVQRGMELCRLDLDSLTLVEVTQTPWRRGDNEELLPGVVLHFRYISRERRRSYVMLDDDPQHALQMLSDTLRGVAEENRRRGATEGSPGGPRLQCLRCSSEFTLQGAAALRVQGRGTGVEGEDLRESTHGKEGNDGGSNTVCPECRSDHVVHLADQSAPSCSTPIKRAREQDSPAHDIITPLESFTEQLLSGVVTLSSSPILDSTSGAGPRTGASATTIASEHPTSLFLTAQGSSFFAGESHGDSWAESSLSRSAECQGREELAGSYHYESMESFQGADAGDDQNGADCPDRSSPGDDLDLLSEDYEAVDHRLQLFLDMEVFEEEEELHSFLKMSTVTFGDVSERPCLLVVSNQRIYFLDITSDAHTSQLSGWLQKKGGHPITDLSYLEVGLGSQTIHMEFEEGGVAYTLLVRDSGRCKRFFATLTGVVREKASRSTSKLQSISTTRLSPQHHLWPLVCEEDEHTDEEEGHLQFFYLLAFLFQENSWTPSTVLATRETLYLLREDHQWCKSLYSSAANESGDSSGAVTVLDSQPISCVSSVHLWSSDTSRIDIQLYDETVKEEKTWSIRSERAELTSHLLAWVRTQWETMFGVTLATSLQDATS